MLLRFFDPNLAEAGPDRNGLLLRPGHDGDDGGSVDVDPPQIRRKPRRRSLWALAGLALGYLIAREFQVPHSWPFFVACALLALAASLWRRADQAPRLLLAAMIAFGIGWYTLRLHEQARYGFNAIAPALDANDPLAPAVPVRLIGRVVEPPAAQLDPPPNAALATFFRSEPTRSFTIALRAAEASSSLSTDPSSGATSATARASGLVRVRVRVPCIDDATPLLGNAERLLRAGDPIRIEGLFRPVRAPMNPGERDRRLWAAQDGLVGTVHAPSSDLITVLPSEDASGLDRALAPIRRAIAALRASTREALRHGLPDQDAADPAYPRTADPAHHANDHDDTRANDSQLAQGRALLAAMLLGAREEHLPQITDAFTRLGLTHLVAISGFNMVVLAGLVLLAVRLTGDRGMLEPFIACAVIAIYLVILPLESPSLRGGLMVIAFLLADAAGRRYDRLTVLGWLALLLAIVQPLDVFAAGYQLTFGIVAALITITPRFAERLFGPELRGVQKPALPVGRSPEARAQRAGMRLRRSIISTGRTAKLAVASAITAWAVATPIVVYHTGLVSLLAPITTLIVGPLCSLFIAAGYAALLLGAIWPSAAEWLSPVLDVLATGLVGLVHTLDAVPAGTVRTPPVSPLLTVAFVLLAVWWLTRGRLRDARTLAFTAAALVWLSLELTLVTRLPSDTRLRIDVLAVGDGSCLLIRSADQSALWDCGSLNPYLGSRVIPDALRQLGVTRLDKVFITHANLDHFAALADVVHTVPVDRVITTDAFMTAAKAGRHPDAPGWQRAAAAFHDQLASPPFNIPFETVQAGQQLQLGHARVHVLWPDADAIATLDPPPRRINPNDLSLVARFDVPVTVPGDVSAQTRSLLLTGDAARLALPILLETHAPELNAGITDAPVGNQSDPPDDSAPIPDNPRHALRAEILELPHHGSFNEPAAEFLRRVNPSVVLQSTGPRRATDPRWASAAPDFFPRTIHPADTTTPAATAPSAYNPHAWTGRAWLTTAQGGWSAVTISRDGTIRTTSMHAR